MSILFAAAGGLLKLVQEKRGPPDQQGQGGGSSGQGAYGPQGGGGGGGGPSSMLGGGRGLGNNKLFALYKFAESSVGNRGQQQQQSGEDAYGGRQQQQQQQQYGPGAAASGSGYAPMAPVEEYTPPPEPTMSCGQFVEVRCAYFGVGGKSALMRARIAEPHSPKQGDGLLARGEPAGRAGEALLRDEL